ncbi:MAG: DUF2268 domain-containing putative Zn-dependent protease [Sphingomonas sp.]|jgi:hypothetical protein|uniref:DUF2268 domain-containing putative Zn-dependent protease n=1 Tax=Sphingomonas sp. TaxID=28214 RepID=UPI0035656450
MMFDEAKAVCGAMLRSEARRAVTCIALMLSAIASLAVAQGGPPTDPIIETGDVVRFYQLYDAKEGHPSADQIQREYLDPGSDGLHQLARLRRVTGEAIAQAMAAHPETYSDARRCMAALPAVKRRLAVSLATLRQLYPQGSFPPVTIAVSRTKPVGMTDAGGVRIGLEALCATTYLNPDIEDRFVHVIAHEYGHIQQDAPLRPGEARTVLAQSLIEGGGEFTAELISGEVGNQAPGQLAKGHEKEIETRFVADMGKTDLSAWLYNGTNQRPGDLGYWVGYRIIKAYYLNARDKRQAIRDIFLMQDPKAFLRKSGWHPGMRLASIAPGNEAGKK